MPRAAVFLLTFLSLVSSAAAEPTENQAAPTPARSQTRYLIICVDGASYSVAEEMYRRGELPNFQPPAALLSTFPSLTDPALVEMLKPLGAPPSRGYEDYYFDRAQNRMRGGFFHRFRRRDFIAGTFRERFDYHPHPILMTLEYAVPVAAAWLGGHITLSRIFGEFERSPKPYYLAYLDGSDPLVHLSGQRLLRGLLRRIDRNIPRLRRRSKAPVEVIVFSDHGNHARRYRRAPLARALKRAGFRVENSLRSARSVVYPQYGLVGSAVLYTQPGLEAEAAAAVRSAEGVGVVAFREGSTILVENAAGRARISRRDEHYCYQPETGDPLELDSAMQSLAAQAALDSKGCASTNAWVEATQGHPYPDPVRRLWFAFDELVAQPASVVVSLQDGYYVGSRLLDLFAWLRATHGSLAREQSLAFVLATTDTLPPFLRGDQLMEAIPEFSPSTTLPRAWHGFHDFAAEPSPATASPGSDSLAGLLPKTSPTPLGGRLL